jgi:hypothetical protein
MPRATGPVADRRKVELVVPFSISRISNRIRQPFQTSGKRDSRVRNPGGLGLNEKKPELQFQPEHSMPTDYAEARITALLGVIQVGLITYGVLIIGGTLRTLEPATSWGGLLAFCQNYGPLLYIVPMGWTLWSLGYLTDSTNPDNRPLLTVVATWLALNLALFLGTALLIVGAIRHNHIDIL